MKLSPNLFGRTAFNASLPVLLVAAFAGSQASATTATWNKTSGGPYSWDVNANWTAAFPNGTGETASLNVNYSAVQTINLNQAITVGTLNLGDTTTGFFATTIAPNGGSLIMDNGGSSATISKATAANTALDTISANIALTDNLIVTNAATSSAGGLTLSGIISGSSKTLTKNGAGILTLSGANTFSGGVSLSAGTLILGNNAALGAGTLTLSGGTTLNVNAARTTTNNVQTWNGGTYTFTGTNTLDLGTGAVTMSANSTWQVKASTLNIGGSISGTGFNLSKYDNGTLILSGANTYTGQTSVTTGVLRLNNATALTGGIGKTGGNTNLRLNGGVAELTSASGDFLRNLGTGAAQVQLANVSGFSAFGTARTVRFNDSATTLQWGVGSFAPTTLILNGYTATAKLTLDHSIDLTGANRTISVLANVAEITGGISNSAGTATLTKTGGGVLTLSATNTYTGATLVSGGTLAINGNTSTSLVTVGTGATLQGRGAISGSVTVQGGGTLASGNSIESLATGALTLQALSTFAYELNNDAMAGVAGDLTAVTGNLNIDLTTAAILTLSDLGSGSWTVGDKLTLISYSGTWNGGLFEYDGSTLADDSNFNFSGMDWTFNYNDTGAGTNYTSDLTGTRFVTMTAVPEPSAAALLGAFGVLALLRRRRA